MQFLTPLSVIGTIMQIGGQLSAAASQKTAATNARIAADYRARQAEQAAGQQIAAAQRGKQEEQRRAELVASRALAVMGASGAGSTDPTAMKIISDISGEGAYRAGVRLYEGEEQARQLRQGADTARLQGEIDARAAQSRARAYRWGAVGSLLTGASALYSRFGGGGPQQSPAPVESRSLLDPYEIDDWRLR